MGSIRELDYNTVVKIAAGEVIDRPASVIRELIDNSIDAGADRISVHINNGGKTYIEVNDNGRGMDKDDLSVCARNHTTSKIKDFGDITAIKTLGFRGEALSSIAEVAHLIIKSRPADAIGGYLLESEFGDIKAPRDEGMNVGTIVIVKGLFDNLPARKKFMTGDSSETRQVDKEIIKKALAYPNVSFELTVNGKQKYSTPSRNSKLERISDFFPDIVEHAISVESLSPGLTISGFITKPAFIRKNRNHQFLFVNNRAVEWKNFFFAVSNVYGNLIPKGHHPAAFIYLDIAPEQIDFNVHPMKREVRFDKPSDISRAIGHAVKVALMSDNGISPADESVIKFSPYEQKVADAISGYMSEQHSLNFQNTDNKPRDMSIPTVNPYDTGRGLNTSNPTDYSTNNNEAINPPQSEHNSFDDILSYRFVGVAFSTYILMEGPDKMIFIDQHAAHERINYEKLKRKFQGEIGGTQELLIPINIDVPLSIIQDMGDNLEILNSMGFDVEHFGGNTFVIRSTPEYVGYQDAPEIVMGFVETLLENSESGTAEKQHASDFVDDAIKQMACKRSIKAGDSITREECLSLIENLLQTERPFSCPHGRPVMFSLPKGDIDKQFKRLGF